MVCRVHMLCSWFRDDTSFDELSLEFYIVSILFCCPFITLFSLFVILIHSLGTFEEFTEKLWRSLQFFSFLFLA